MKRVLDFIKQEHLVEEGDRVILGVSGGADSVYLLLCFCALKQQMDMDLFVVHVNHKLRQEADREETFVKGLCERLHVAFESVAVDVGKLAKDQKISLEEAGRQARYDAFYKAYREHNGTKIAVAHHINDQAETFLFRVARGTGLMGAGAMKPKDLPLIRPLLCVNKEEIYEKLQKEHQTWMEDGSNEDATYARNQIRHYVIPELEKVNQQAVEHMAVLCEDVREATDYLRQQVTEAYGRLVSTVDGEEVIQVEQLLALDPWIGKQVAKTMLETVAGKKKDIEKRHVLDLLDLAKNSTGKTIDLPYGVGARKSYQQLMVFSKEDTKKVEEGTLKATKLKEFPDIKENDCIKIIDYDRIENSVILRYRQVGDVISIDDSGKTKSLKKYFIDEKIPRYLRDRVPLVADGNRIIWIVGHRLSHYYKVTKDTKQCMKLEFKRERGE